MKTIEQSAPVTMDLGCLSGSVLVFGGAYSNYEALSTVKLICEEYNIPASNIINTGDIVGYYADPDRCVHFIRKWGINSIAGNVEIQLRNGADDCGCNLPSGSRCDMYSRKWYPYAKSNTGAAALSYLQTLPDHLTFTYAGKRCTVVHGSYFQVSEYIFKSTPWEVKAKSLTASNSDVIIGGHAGIPFNDTADGRYWLNPGAIGMPANDGTSRVWCMLLRDDRETFHFEHFSFLYDYEKTYLKMTEQSLPIIYARTLYSGLWDNCEILPEAEASLQGEIISFEHTPFEESL